MTTGIYLLKFNNTTKVYIGQAFNIEGRYSRHKDFMKRGVASKKLVEAYNTYGIPSLNILIECEKKELDALETEAIEIFDSVDNGFNTYRTPLGRNDQVGEDASNAKYTNEVYEEIFILLVDGFSRRSISEYLNVSIQVVTSIASCENHKWLQLKYPDKYEVLLTRKKNYINGYEQSAEYRGIKYPKIISPTGEIFDVLNLREFARKYGFESANLHSLLVGKLTTLKGWKLKDTIIKEYPPIKSPSGEVYKIPYRGARVFAEEHHLSVSYLSQLMSGKISTYKGWKLA